MPTEQRRGSGGGALSLRAFARRVGVDEAAVRKGIRNGRLERSIGQRRGRPVILDVALAMREWADNRDPAKGRAPRNSTASARETRPRSTKSPGGRTRDTAGPPIVDPGGDAAADTFAAVRRRATEAQAQLREQEVARRAGELVSRADVRREAYEVARTVRETLTNIPDRVAHALAAETDPARVHAALSEEIRRALEGLVGVLEAPVTAVAAG